jgi:hypothetical protein
MLAVPAIAAASAASDVAAVADAPTGGAAGVAPVAESRISAPMIRQNCRRSASACARTTPDSEHSSVIASAA